MDSIFGQSVLKPKQKIENNNLNDNKQTSTQPEVNGQGDAIETTPLYKRSFAQTQPSSNVAAGAPLAPAPPPPPPPGIGQLTAAAPEKTWNQGKKKVQSEAALKAQEKFAKQAKSRSDAAQGDLLAEIQNRKKNTGKPTGNSGTLKSQAQRPPQRQNLQNTLVTAKPAFQSTAPIANGKVVIPKTNLRTPLTKEEKFEALFADDDPVVINPETLPEATTEAMQALGIKTISQEIFDQYTFDMFCSTERDHYVNQLTRKVVNNIKRVEDAHSRHLGLKTLFAMAKDDKQSIQLLRLIARDDHGDLPEGVTKDMFKGIEKETASGKVKLPKGMVEVVAAYDPKSLPKELFKGIKTGEKNQNEKLAQAIVHMISRGEMDKLPEDLVTGMVKSSGRAFPPQQVLRESNFKLLEMHMRKDKSGWVAHMFDPANVQRLKSFLKVINSPKIKNLILSKSDHDLANHSKLRANWKDELRAELMKMRENDQKILDEADTDQELNDLLDAAETDYISKSEGAKKPNWSDSSNQSMSDRLKAFKAEGMSGFKPTQLILDYYNSKAVQLKDRAKEKGDAHPVKSACWQLRDKYNLVSSASDYRKKSDEALQKNLRSNVDFEDDEINLIPVHTLQEYRKLMAGKSLSDEIEAAIDHAAAEAVDRRMKRDASDFAEAEHSAWTNIKSKVQAKPKRQ
ncbi:hypothetical protein [Endozoicomonas elysicola]|uniref:Uncharacterized protein n=1 Tax=Endozoicomonas elysicola TaxID=305900 RepID=A0A081K6A3_9GAMM|nr:hypothetical protein [Endozoicomonas elysicola]KEI69679.1 hypothetical protein GV64_02005 [Endozoicomonas elysicola]